MKSWLHYINQCCEFIWLYYRKQCVKSHDHIMETNVYQQYVDFKNLCPRMPLLLCRQFMQIIYMFNLASQYLVRIYLLQVYVHAQQSNHTKHPLLLWPKILWENNMKPFRRMVQIALFCPWHRIKLETTLVTHTDLCAQVTRECKINLYK